MSQTALFSRNRLKIIIFPPTKCGYLHVSFEINTPFLNFVALYYLPLSVKFIESPGIMNEELPPLSVLICLSQGHGPVLVIKLEKEREREKDRERGREGKEQKRDFFLLLFFHFI